MPAGIYLFIVIFFIFFVVLLGAFSILFVHYLGVMAGIEPAA
jgi:hypothetical protein